MVGSHEVAGKNTHLVVAPPYEPIGAVDSPNQWITSLASHAATYGPVAFH